MTKVIVSDTSCLIVLANIREIDLLNRVFGRILTTPEVADEFGESLPEWIEIRSPKNHKEIKRLESLVDIGEASAIALALELENSVIILDDYKARKIAERYGVQMIGTMGVLVKAKKLGIIEAVKPLIVKIRETNFRISEDLEKRALDESGE
ncbi:MAG: DUF3368 domain-containing protein [Bacteroidota bacterium]|jgi:predicted nucleic acid-binding protein